MSTLTKTIQVKLFAAAKQIAQKDLVQVDLPASATIADLRKALAAKYPPLADLISLAAFAIDMDFANDESVIPTDADVACIPPVSGG